MTDTPRVDAVLEPPLEWTDGDCVYADYAVLRDVARQLERELAETIERCAKVCDAHADYHRHKLANAGSNLAAADLARARIGVLGRVADEIRALHVAPGQSQEVTTDT